MIDEVSVNILSPYFFACCFRGIRHEFEKSSPLRAGKKKKKVLAAKPL
jgi:hypothetical protein